MNAGADTLGGFEIKIAAVEAGQGIGDGQALNLCLHASC